MRVSARGGHRGGRAGGRVSRAVVRPSEHHRVARGFSESRERDAPPTRRLVAPAPACGPASGPSDGRGLRSPAFAAFDSAKASVRRMTQTPSKIPTTSPIVTSSLRDATRSGAVVRRRMSLGGGRCWPGGGFVQLRPAGHDARPSSHRRTERAIRQMPYSSDNRRL